jgi:hypothetical protein
MFPHAFAAVAGLLILVVVLRDAFETIVLPRRVNRRFRLTAGFYRTTWPPWRLVANAWPARYRESSLSWYGPCSLLLLIALWAFGIIVAFGVLHWSAGSALKLDGGHPSFFDDVYLSGTTFFTLGMGDVVPRVPIAKVLTVCEAGLGFGFLAVVIGYLPVIYQAFSRREIAISLLDARAGSPPSASELLWRHRDDAHQQDLVRLLLEWERWSAEVLESHLSYPVLAYFRSQHANTSWLAALTTILDTSALAMVGFDGWCMHQAQLTFAMARHAAVDLAQVFNARQPTGLPPRMSEDDFIGLSARLQESGLPFRGAAVAHQLDELRQMYEPYVQALGLHLALPLPPWKGDGNAPDNWRGAPWKTRTEEPRDNHFS